MLRDNILYNTSKFLLAKRTNGGYTLPLVLFAITGVTILVASSIRTSISRGLAGRNLVNAEIVDDTAESFLQIYKGILNSNTNQSLNYFWLSQSCSPTLSPSKCPPDYINAFNSTPSGIALPSLIFFQDSGEKWESYCHAFTSTGNDTLSTNCFGRAAAPICSVHSRNNPSFAIPWQSYKQTIDRFYKDFELYPNLASYNNKAAPYSLFYKKTNIGSPELGGELWIDIKSSAVNKNTSKLKSSKSFRVRFSVDKFIDSSKFAYLSAGSYHSSNAAYSLTNLQVKADSRKPVRGIILLRRNLPTTFNCSPSSIYNFFNIKDTRLTSSLPTKANGGLAIHAVKYPNVPDNSTPNPLSDDLRRFVVRGTKIFRTNGNERTLKFENLFLTRDSTLVLETSSDYPVNLIIKDSLDVAPGARICNVEIGRPIDSCGSGNPVNLLIKGNHIVWQKQNSESSYRFVDSPTTEPDPSNNRVYPFTDNEAFCSTGEGGFGELIAANNNPSVISPRPKSQKPGPSFSFSSTGGSNDMLSAFIVGKYVSFNAPAVSTLPPLLQAPFYEEVSGNQKFNGSSFIANHRGRLVAVNIQPYIEVGGGFQKACNSPNCIFTLLSPPENRYRPFSRITLNNIDPHRTSTPYFNVSPDSRTLDSRFILAVASSNYPSSSPPNIWISYNWKTKEYKILPFTVSSERTNKNWIGRQENASYLLLNESPTVNINYNGKILPTTFTSTHPSFLQILSFLEDFYQIKLTSPSTSPYINDRTAGKESLTTSKYRRYKGAIWTKNICFSINRQLNREIYHEFTFPAAFSQDLSKRFSVINPNHDLDYGMRSYKYTHTSNWDASKGF